MLGHAVPHAGVSGSCWSDQYDLTLQVCGDLTATPVVDGSLAARNASVVFIRDTEPVGAVCMNRPHEFRDLERRITLRDSAGGPEPPARPASVPHPGGQAAAV
jgi:hypothetical protein